MPQHTPARQSSYYPPRAGIGRVPRRLLSSLRTVLHLERLHVPPLPGFCKTLAAALIPGLAFHFNGPRFVAKVIWIGVALMFLLFLAGLGTIVAEMAFGLMIGAHVASVSHLLRTSLIHTRLLLQLVFGVVLFVAISIVVYTPARGWFHSHVAIPLNVRGQVIVMNPRADATDVEQGDRVVYRISASRGDNLIVRAGMGFQAVLGLPGDLVVFGDDAITVNQQRQLLPGSRKEWGAVVVPEECWFIWPELNIMNRGVAASSVADTLRRLAIVEHRDLVGRSYAWWFFRAQGSK